MSAEDQGTGTAVGEIAASTDAAPEPGQEAPEDALSFFEVLRTGDEKVVKEGWSRDIAQALERFALGNYYCLGLLDPERSIETYELDRIFAALQENNSSKEKDVLLVLLSPGGRIEPAYQISKICKSFSKRRFVVAVPRLAKSAATLIALGADEIHMGPLGQLGPIDPQLGSLPALGVSQALERIAALAEKYPGSANMFATYLRMAMTVEQIGYCERISVSAEQYAQRLLSNKESLRERATAIAKELVNEYKDHSFVIDLEEAQQHLGKDWVVTGTAEMQFAESVYRSFKLYNLFMEKRRLLVIGDLRESMVWATE